MSWPLPSARGRDLIRRGAEIALNAPPEWLEELDQATLASNPQMAEDPELTAAASRTNRANLLVWASANLRDPGAPVPANLGSEPLAIARDLVRRGLDHYALDGYRVGQNIAWRRWMQIAFTLTENPAELAELLDVTAQSIAAFIDDTMAGINAQMQRERAELTGGSQADRREVVALILDGAPSANTAPSSDWATGLPARTPPPSYGPNNPMSTPADSTVSPKRSGTWPAPGR